MKETALICGKIILEKKNDDVVIDNKTGVRDLVTNYDLRVQEKAVEILSKAFPDAGYYAEEENERCEIDKGMVFIIDPIDGTANFANNMNLSVVSIACFIDGEPFAGAVYDPYTDELFSAQKGLGAYLNEKRIHVTGKDLIDSLTLFGTSPYNLELFDETINKLRHVFPLTLDVRRCGSAAMDICYVAAGKAGLFFEEILAIWDVAAAMLILSEAGGEIYTCGGEKIPLDGRKTSVIAGSRKNIIQSGLLNI